MISNPVTPTIEIIDLFSTWSGRSRNYFGHAVTNLVTDRWP